MSLSAASLLPPPYRTAHNCFHINCSCSLTAAFRVIVGLYYTTWIKCLCQEQAWWRHMWYMDARSLLQQSSANCHSPAAAILCPNMHYWVMDDPFTPHCVQSYNLGKNTATLYYRSSDKLLGACVCTNLFTVSNRDNQNCERQQKLELPRPGCLGAHCHIQEQQKYE